MMRAIGNLFGYGQTNSQTSQLSKQPSQWIKDDNGQWMKVGALNTTASIVSQINKQHNNSSNNTSNNKVSDEVADDTSNANSEDDALDFYQEQLKKTKVQLVSTLEKWKLLKEEVISHDPSLSSYSNIRQLVYPHGGILEGINKFFIDLFVKIKRNLEPASTELEELLQQTREEIQILSTRLQEEDERLKQSKTEQEGRRICVEMCNTNMEMINDLIILVDSIQSELSYCLKFVNISQATAKEILIFLVTLMTGFPVPDFELDFKDTYKRFLYQEIELQKKESDQLESDAIGISGKSMEEVKEYEANWDEHKVKVANNTLFSQQTDNENKETPNESQNTINKLI